MHKGTLHLLFWITTALLSSTIIGCDYKVINSHLNPVGEINPNKSISPEGYDVCIEENIFPYYYTRHRAGFLYKKDSLKRFFIKKYNSYGIHDASGYVTVRFVINCNGKAGRFVVHSNGPDYKTKDLHPKLVDQLLNLTMGITEWRPLKRGDFAMDSYYHLTFKLVNGELVEILP